MMEIFVELNPQESNERVGTRTLVSKKKDGFEIEAPKNPPFHFQLL